MATNRQPDNMQRTAVITVGAALMTGAIAWASSWTFAMARGSWLRLLPAVAMFLVGAVLVVWAAKRPTARKHLLRLIDQLSVEGDVISSHPGQDALQQGQAWHNKVMLVLQSIGGPGIADLFEPVNGPGFTLQAPQGGAPGLIKSQLEQLRHIRSGVADGTLKLTGPVR